MLAEQYEARIRTASSRAKSSSATPKPLYGADIFAGTDYPQNWNAFVGQKRAVAQLQAACYSARRRQKRLDHVLLASGAPGIGKTSLAKLVAADLGTGIVEVSGAVSLDDARPVLMSMTDGDVLFYDEFHQAVMGGKAKAEWLLHLLQDGLLRTKHGIELVPDVTVIAATTDAQRLPTTVLGRFPVRPVLEPYTLQEATTIASSIAARLGFGTDVPDFTRMEVVAEAGNGNPREMKAVLVALRDSYFVSSTYDVDLALEWAGVTKDGLTKLAQDYLIALLTSCEGRGGEKLIASILGEPGPLRHTEQLLMQKGYLVITPSGRELTEPGVERTERLLRERGLL